MKRWTSAFTVIAVAVAVAPGELQGQVVGTKGAKLPFEIGKETTAITEPLLPNGMPDYVRALNEKYGKGVTPESNALLPWLKIRGVEVSIDEKVRGKFLEMAGAPGDEAGATYFMTLEAYAKERGWAAEAGNATDLLNEVTQEGWHKPVPPHVTEYLRAEARFFELATEASKKRDFYVPYASADGTLGGMELFRLTGMVHFARAWAARGSMRVGMGDIKGAIADVRAIKRTSRLFMKHGSLIATYMGYAWDAIGTSLAETLFHSEKLGVEDCDALGEALDVAPLESAGPYLDTLERWLVIAGLQAHATHALEATLADETDPKRIALYKSIDLTAMDWNVAMKEINQWRDRQVAVANATTFSELERGQKELTAMSDGWKKEFDGHEGLLSRLPNESRDNYSKRVVHGSIVQPPGFDLLKHEETRRNYHLIQVMQLTLLHAVKVKAEKGEAPRTIRDLVPVVVREMPVDPHSARGQKLLYFLVEGRPTVASVGQDGEAGTGDDLYVGG